MSATGKVSEFNLVERDVVMLVAVAPQLLYPTSMACDRARLWQHAAIFGAVLLTLAVGFCLAGGEHGSMTHDGMSPDLCLGMLAVTLTVLRPWAPLMSGWVDARRPVALVPVPIHVLEPPPKSLARF